MVKAHLVTVLVLDCEDRGDELDSFKSFVVNSDFFSNVVGSKTREIGEWHDDHPLNSNELQEEEIKRLFGDIHEW